MTKEKAAATQSLAKLSSLKANVSREFDGDWVEHPDLPGFFVCVRSFNYPPYKVARDLWQRQMQKKYRDEISEARDAEADVGAGRLYAKYLLLSWKGSDEEYTAERAMEYLTDTDWRPFREFVEVAAMKVGQKKAEFVEVAAKN